MVESLSSLPSLPSLASLACALSMRAPTGVAGWRDGVEISHGQLMARMADWANLLAREPGRRYALYLEDSLEFGAALLGAWQAGKTVWLLSLIHI